MGGGQKIIGLWRNHADTHDAMNVGVSIDTNSNQSETASTKADLNRSGERGVVTSQVDEQDVFLQDANQNENETMAWLPSDESPATNSLFSRAVTPLISVLAIVWIAFAFWAITTTENDFSRPGQWFALIAQACVPLALLAMVYLIVQRNSRSEANRYGLIVQKMEQQSAQVEAKLLGLNTYLKTSYDELGHQADQVVQFGLQTAEQLQLATRQIRDALGDGLNASNQLTQNSQRAMLQFDALVAGLPKVDDVATRLTENLRDAGRTAHKHGSAIEAQIAAIGQIVEQSSNLLKEQEEQLQTRLDDMASKAENTRQLVEQASLAAESSYNDVGARAHALFASLHDETAKFSDEHLSHIEALHGRISGGSEQTLSLLSERINSADNAVSALATRIQEQESYSQSLTTQLSDALRNIDSEFAAFDQSGRERLDQLASAVAALESHTEGLTSKVQLGSEGTNHLIGKSESLLVALDGVTRELEESLPTAFARLNERLSASRNELAKMSPELERVEAVADATLGRLRESDGLVQNQFNLLSESERLSLDAASAQKATLDELESALANVNDQATTLSEQTGPRLLEALLRVRETAVQASERAREALISVIPDSANMLGEASAKALTGAVDVQFEAKLAKISDAAERAVAATDAAAAQLIVKIEEIEKSSAIIEQRVIDTKALIQESDRDTLTRRVSLLTESLNNTALDVSKILSRDVSDSAWEAYLNGDRSVFTRRAVMMVNNSESREILRHYENDADFHNHVNHYIRDFESILRNLMESRDGTSLSVALLSSDMGKLYVALAQAIERLRN